MELAVVTVVVAFLGVVLISFTKAAFGSGFSIVGIPVPWLLLARPDAKVWMVMAICLFTVPFGVPLVWQLRGRLDQRQVYRACYGLLVVTAAKLFWDGASGYLS